MALVTDPPKTVAPVVPEAPMSVVQGSARPVEKVVAPVAPLMATVPKKKSASIQTISGSRTGRSNLLMPLKEKSGPLVMPKGIVIGSPVVPVVPTLQPEEESSKF